MCPPGAAAQQSAGRGIAGEDAGLNPAEELSSEQPELADPLEKQNTLFAFLDADQCCGEDESMVACIPDADSGPSEPSEPPQPPPPPQQPAPAADTGTWPGCGTHIDCTDTGGEWAAATSLAYSAGPALLELPDVIPPPLDADIGKPCVVFDFDETLVQNRTPPLVKRPHVDALLRAIKDTCELVLWTASTEECAGAAVDVLDPDRTIFRHRVFRNDSWFTGLPYTKDLTRLKRDMRRTIIIENTPDCVRLNPSNALLVEDYVGLNEWDNSLKAVRHVAQLMVNQPWLSVGEILSSSRYVYPLHLTRRDSAEHESPVHSFYYVNTFASAAL
eukprot:TRINITY_DN421_c4_g1_i1.p1 TRINITY_DN421_c4_g1~~TRINITY_DN421_c4_g1_i1.p1  ORF type:complete len:355 (+),score=105.44 TRINITY_DN421_c4_g1_i1:73-1065(+)